MNRKSSKREGRIQKGPDPLMERFNASIGFDRKLYREDIRGSIAQANALCGAGVLSKAECTRIVRGLRKVEEEVDSGKLSLTDDLEDIHMAVEKRLIEIVGLRGKAPHGTQPE